MRRRNRQMMNVSLREVSARQLTDPKEIKVLMMKAKKCRCEREESERTRIIREGQN